MEFKERESGLNATTLDTARGGRESFYKNYIGGNSHIELRRRGLKARLAEEVKTKARREELLLNLMRLPIALSIRESLYGWNNSSRIVISSDRTLKSNVSSVVVSFKICHKMLV